MVLSIRLSADISELSDCVTGYVRFYEESAVPRATITIYSNNKPRVPKERKKIERKIKLNRKRKKERKKKNFWEGDKVEQKKIQKGLKQVGKEGTEAYKQKTEQKCNNVKQGLGRDEFKEWTQGKKKCGSRRVQPQGNMPVTWMTCNVVLTLVVLARKETV